MVAHALHEISHQLCIEKGHGKFEQLDKKVAHQWIRNDI